MESISIEIRDEDMDSLYQYGFKTVFIHSTSKHIYIMRGLDAKRVECTYQQKAFNKWYLAYSTYGLSDEHIMDILKFKKHIKNK